MSLNRWTPAQFLKLQKIAARHDRHCPLRLAMVTGDDGGGTLVCNCNGKLNVFGEPKTRPRERTLAEAMEQIEAMEGEFMTRPTRMATMAAMEGGPEDRHPYRASCDCVRCDHVRGDVEPECEPDDSED